MKVLGISGGPRKEGNSDLLLREALEGAGSAGADTEYVALRDLTVAPCVECNACCRTGDCRIEDDFQSVLQHLLAADRIIFASPIFFMGVAQVGILILASSIFFQVKWGDALGIIVLILAAVFGATGWGMLITSIAKTTAQVSNTGSAIMLIFGIMGGSFISLEQFPPFMRTISKITPNSWGLDGFTTLALGGTLKNLNEPITALLIMGAVLFGIAVLLFNRNGLVQK